MAEPTREARSNTRRAEASAAPRPRRRSGSALRLIAVAFAVAALGGVLWVADMNEVMARLRGADPLPLAGAAAAFFAIYPLSAVRLLRSVALPLRPHMAAATLVGLRHTFLLTRRPRRCSCPPG